MKKVLLTGTALLMLASGSAMAADLSRAAPAPVYTKAPMMPVFTWTGFYIGGNLGGAWAHRDVTDSLFGLNFSNGNNNNGVFIAGGQVGGNYQFNNFVVGVEGTFDWAANNNNTTTGIAVPGGNIIQVTSNNTWLSTLVDATPAAVRSSACEACGSRPWISSVAARMAESMLLRIPRPSSM